MSEVATRQMGFGLLADLEAAGYVDATGLRLDLEIEFDTWESIGRMLGAVGRTTRWLTGDWLNFGEAVYGERYAQGASATGLTEGTLINYASVCKRIPRERRRRNLSFGHHEVIAALEPEQQTLWLDRAEENEWSRAELRQALAPPKNEQPQWSDNAGGRSEEVEALVDVATQTLDGTRPYEETWHALASGVVELASVPVEARALPPAPDGSAALREACRRLLAEAEQIDDVDILRFLVPAERVMEIAKLLKEEEE